MRVTVAVLLAAPTLILAALYVRDLFKGLPEGHGDANAAVRQWDEADELQRNKSYFNEEDFD